MTDFVAAYNQKYGTDPDVWSGHGYDAILLCAAALKASTSSLPQEFLKGMRAMDPLTGVTGNIQFDEKGNVQKFARIHTIQDGKLLDYRKWRQEREKAIRKRIDDLRLQSERLRNQGRSED